MNADTITKESSKGLTDWQTIQALNETSVLKAAISDPLIQPVEEIGMSEFNRIYPTDSMHFNKVRMQLNISIQELANYFGVSIRTLQDWEEGKKAPPPIAKNFLKVIKFAPNVVKLGISA